MRRAGSPGGILIRVCDSFPCSTAETNFRELDDAFLQTQTRIWLGEVLHMRFEEETAVADLLSDGELLFQVSRVVWKMLLKKCRDLEHSKVHIYERTSSGKIGGRYMPYPKVDSFLKICQILGLTGIDLFSPSDVVDKRDTRRVCMCIRSLSKKARMKDLSVPDFDVVTYTIVMPTDMVGCIRRNLEQSQSSSSSSSICCPYIDLSEVYRQKYRSLYNTWKHDSCSESDDAENAFRDLDFQSPESYTSYDSGTLRGLIDKNSPGGNSMVNDNLDLSRNLFKLDPIDLGDEDEKLTGGEAFLAGSNYSCSVETTADVNCQIKVNHTGSPPSRREVQVGLHEGINSLSHTPDTTTFKYDADCMQPCVSSTGDSPSGLDLPFVVNTKEAQNGETCDCTMPCDWGSESHSSRHTVSPSAMYVNQEHTEASSALSISELVESCRLLLEESDNEGSKFMLGLNDRKLKCGENTDFSSMLCASKLPEGSLDDTDGKIRLGERNFLEKDAGNNVEINTSFQSGGSDSIFQNINSNFAALSGNGVVDDASGVNYEIFYPKTGDSVYNSRSKSFNEFRDTEMSPTDSPCFSCQATTVACESLLNACSISSNESSVQLPGIHCFEQKKQGNITTETSMEEFSKDSDDDAILTSELRDLDLEEKSDLASSKKDDVNTGAADLVKSSPSAHESLDTVKLDIYHSYPGADSYLENKDNYSTHSFSSTTELQACFLGFENHGYCTSSKDEKIPFPNEVTSDNTTVSTAAEEQYTSVNGLLDISSLALFAGQINAALKDEEHKTAEKLDIGGRKSSSCLMSCPENGGSNQFDENHPVACVLDPLKEKKMKNIFASQPPDSCATCDMPTRVKQECPNEPCAQDGLSGFVENGPGESIDCTVRSEDDTRICSELTKRYSEHLNCNLSSDADKSCTPHGIFFGSYQQELICGSPAKESPLLTDLSSQGPMQETNFDVPDIKADGIASVCNLIHSVDSVEAYGLQMGGMEVPLNFRTNYRSLWDLNVADVSIIDDASLDGASLVNLVDDTAHSGIVPNISGSLPSKSEISRTAESQSCSISTKSGRNSSADETIGLEDYGHPLVYEEEACMNNNVTDSAGKPTLSERCEMDLQSTPSTNRGETGRSRGREHNPVKNMLLKSFTGGVTLLGTLFLVHYLRKRRSDGILGKTAGQLHGQKRKQQAPAHEGVESVKVDALYPGDRLKF